MIDEYLKQKRIEEHNRREKREKREMLIAGIVLIIGALIAAMFLWAANAKASTQAGEVADRLAVGMEAWKRAGAVGRWWSCGVAQEDGAGIAREVGALIEVEAARNDLNPWGLAGVLAKESKFDECALGKRSRDLGYATGLLKRNPLTISHTAADVLAVLGSKRWKQEIGKADLGMPQVMYPTIYKGDPAALLNREAGVREAAEEMARRAVRIGAVVKAAVLRPWGGWPGWYDSRYDESIVRYARALGATEADLAGLPKGRSVGMRHTTMVEN